MYSNSISASCTASSASASQWPATPLSDDEHSFIKELVQINNARDMDGIRGREGESITWFENAVHDLENIGFSDGTELKRQRARHDRAAKEQPTLLAYAASACAGAIKDTSDLRRAIQFINSPEATPKLQASLKSEAALAILRVRNVDDPSLAMAIAKERAANGTPIYELCKHNGPFNDKDYRKLSLAAAEGVVGDLAAGEAHIGSIMYQFGLISDEARKVLQWRAVDGAAGRAVKAGMRFETALLKYGFHYGHDSTNALECMANAARIEGNRQAI